MGRGTFQVSFELLKHLLHLPDEAEVIGVEPDLWGSCTIWVTSADIPTGEVRDCNPRWATAEKEGHYRETVFEGWGIE